jgi:hypothetical protein
VDPDDDSIRRYVVRHYRYDPERHERRHVVVAAFDDRREYDAYLRVAASELSDRKASGLVQDSIEHITGTVLAPGHLRRQQNARLIRRAMAHRVNPQTIIDLHLDLPRNVALLHPPKRESLLLRLAQRAVARWTAGRFAARRPPLT